MSTIEQVYEIFMLNGGKFYIPAKSFAERLKDIHAFVFDWDGVFTDGRKKVGGQSSFSEIDSMGLNLLRFGWYLLTGDVPLFIIITGLNNLTAIEFSRREHFDALFQGFKNKKSAFDFLQDNYPVNTANTAFFFDDVLDLSINAEVALRFMVGRKSNPGFNEYVIHHQLSDYCTAVSGGEHALRECSELCLMMMDIFNETMEHRIAFSNAYNQYWQMRQRIQLRIFADGKQHIQEMF